VTKRKFDPHVRFCTDDATWLTCPGCGGEYSYLHHEAVTAYERAEDAPTTRVVRSNGQTLSVEEVPSSRMGNPSTRRDGIAIEFYCELCPTLSKLTVAQHKGCTYMEWRYMGERPEYPISATSRTDAIGTTMCAEQKRNHT
jgi:hypothetical protein